MHPSTEGLLSEYLARYFQEPAVMSWLLQRSKAPVTYATQLKQSLSYACMYFPPSKPPARAPYAPPAPFLDSGDVLIYDRVHGTIAVGELFNPNEQHALALLRDSMRLPLRLSRRPRSRKFAVDLSSPALEIIEFAWLEDNSLIIACRKLKSPPERLVRADTSAQPSQVLTADILFYDVIPENELPTTPFLRMTLNEKPVVCVFCGAHGFASCACSSSFKRRAPSSVVKQMDADQSGVANSNSATAASRDKASKHLATWNSHTERIFAVNQVGSFFVRWYRKGSQDNKLHLWIKPKCPISYRFVCGTKEQTIRLCALYIKHMRLCGDAYSADARLFVASMANPFPAHRRILSGGSKRQAPDPPSQQSQYDEHHVSDADIPQAEFRMWTQTQPLPPTQTQTPIQVPSCHMQQDAQPRPELQIRHGSAPGPSNLMKFSRPQTSVVTGATQSLSPSRRDRMHAGHGPRQPHSSNDFQGRRLGGELGLTSSLVHTGYSRAVDSYAVQYGDGVNAAAAEPGATFVDSSAAEPPHSLHPSGGPAGEADSHCRSANSLNEAGGERDNRQESASRTIPTAELSQYMTMDNDGVPLCRECNTRFEKRGNLSRHVLAVHLKYKPFECDQCPAAFGYKTHMMRHIRTVHRKDRLLQCPHCDVEFRSGVQLAKHRRDQHPACGPSSPAGRTAASVHYDSAQ